MNHQTKINQQQTVATKEQWTRLLKNGHNRDQNHAPVVKLFNPHGAATWLISEVDPDCTDIAFGLCDLGMGYPELGEVSLRELCNMGFIERDLHFHTDEPMSVWADAARAKGGIVWNRK